MALSFMHASAHSYAASYSRRFPYLWIGTLCLLPHIEVPELPFLISIVVQPTRIPPNHRISLGNCLFFFYTGLCNIPARNFFAMAPQKNPLTRNKYDIFAPRSLFRDAYVCPVRSCPISSISFSRILSAARSPLSRYHARYTTFGRYCLKRVSPASPPPKRLTIPPQNLLKIMEYSRPADLSRIIEAAPIVLVPALESGVRQKYGTSALCWAASHGHVELAQTLLKNGADSQVNARAGAGGLTALMHAIYNCHRHMIKLLLLHGANVNMADSKGHTALHLAVRAGLADLVEFLLGQGVDVNRKTYTRGSTALHLATIYRREHRWLDSACLGAIELLVGKGADVAALDSWGRTALHIAAGAPDVEAVGLLLRGSVGYAIDIRDNCGNTAIMMAQRVAGDQVCNLLLKSGADIVISN